MLARCLACRQASMCRGCHTGKPPGRARTEREAGARQPRRRLPTSERRCAREHRTFRLNRSELDPPSHGRVESHGRGEGDRSRAAPGCPASGRCLTSAVLPPVNGSIGFSRGNHDTRGRTRCRWTDRRGRGPDSLYALRHRPGNLRRSGRRLAAQSRSSSSTAYSGGTRWNDARRTAALIGPGARHGPGPRCRVRIGWDRDRD